MDVAIVNDCDHATGAVGRFPLEREARLLVKLRLDLRLYGHHAPMRARLGMLSNFLVNRVYVSSGELR